ncbi:MAG: hypothetical protein AAFY60_11505, partial [Myxococcota bacterium]
PVGKYLRPASDGPIAEPQGDYRLGPRYDGKDVDGMGAWASSYGTDAVGPTRAPPEFGKIGNPRGRISNRKEVFDQLWASLG